MSGNIKNNIHPTTSGYKHIPSGGSGGQILRWSAVGMLGVLSVWDDDTCEVNGYCNIADGGIATKSDSGYRIVKRVNENIVKVIFR